MSSLLVFKDIILYLLDWIMSHKKSVTISMFLYLCIFLMAAFKFFILSLISAILFVSWHGFFYVSLAVGSLSFLALWIYSFQQIWKGFGHFLFKSMFASFLCVWHLIAYHSSMYFVFLFLSVRASFWSHSSSCVFKFTTVFFSALSNLWWIPPNVFPDIENTV